MKSQTLLKKLQKGELDSSSINSNKSSSILKFKVLNRKELIEPYMHSIDYYKLVKDCKNIYKKSEHYNKTNEEFFVPDHYIHDIQSMYENPSVDITYQKKNKHNSSKYKVIDSVYNSLYKMTTESNYLYSNIMTSEIANYLQVEIFSKLTPEEREKMESQMNGDSKGDSSLDNKIEDLLNNSKTQLNDAMENATEQIKDVEDLGFNESGNSESADKGQIDLNTLKEILNKIKNSSKVNLKNFIKDVLDKSKNYFSNKIIYHDDSIFNCDELDELENIEFLHPSFKSSHLFDITSKNGKPVGKVDLYIDCSGSMNAHDKENITRINKAKIMALTLVNMGYVNEVYYFDNSLHKPKQDFKSLLEFNRSGGTNFECVVSNVINNNRNSIILTDGEDSTSQYTEKAFWIGISGAKFTNSFYSGNSKKYLNKKQCIIFKNDGTYYYE